MATVSATFTFSLPEDIDADQLLIYEATSKGGTYSLVDTSTYEYGTTSYEYDSTEDTRWYKIQFNNSVDSESGPLSEPVYGGNFDQTKPLLVVSTGSDGANYATTQDLYDYANLTPADVNRSRVSQALRRARAIVDLKTAELDLDRFTRTFDTEVARRKYNATLRIIREAEINLALGNLYRGLADDKVSVTFRDSDNTGNPSISVGSTSIGSDGSNSTTDNMKELLNIANRYLVAGSAMLAAIQPPSIRIHCESEYVSSPKFKYPFNGY